MRLGKAGKGRKNYMEEKIMGSVEKQNEVNEYVESELGMPSNTISDDRFVPEEEETPWQDRSEYDENGEPNE